MGQHSARTGEPGVWVPWGEQGSEAFIPDRPLRRPRLGWLRDLRIGYRLRLAWWALTAPTDEVTEE